MRAVLAAAAELRQDSRGSMTPAELLQAIGAAETHPEGLFAPDTYLYDPGSSDLDVWRQAYRAPDELPAGGVGRRGPRTCRTSRRTRR